MPICTCSARLPRRPKGIEEMAMDRAHYWAVGTKIAVSFFGGSQAIRNRVLDHANAWAEFGNISFVEARPGRVGDVRASFHLAGYWSYIGPPVGIPADQPTLNLQGFDTTPMPESEWRRVVRHEFGHALGALHEQQRPEVVARLNPQAVLPYFAQTQGWSYDEIRAQILTAYDLDGTDHTAEDDRSIMMYSFDGRLTRDGNPIVGGADLTDLDKQLIARVYPKPKPDDGGEIDLP